MTTVRGRLLQGWTLAVLTVLSGGSIAEAVQPRLTSIMPRGAQRGTEVEIVLRGERLTDATALFVYEPGIEVGEISVVDEKQIKAKLKIASDCPLGSKRFRVRTETGISDAKPFRVGTLPTIEEKEPNSEFVKPQPVTMNVTVQGSIANEDVDYFVVEAKKGQRLTAEIEGIRLGDGMFDPYVAILNEDRFELDTSDDAALVYQDGIAAIVVPEDGKYIVQVRETSYGPGNQYLLHIGDFPRPRAVVPAGGKPGEAVTVTYFGDVAGPFTQTLTLPATTEDEVMIDPGDDRGLAPTGLKFRVSSLDNVVETEPNNAVGEATKASGLAAFNGRLEAPGDVDFFRFPASKGQSLVIQVYGRRLRSEIDPILEIHNANGQRIAANDDTGGPDSLIKFNVPADGEYCVVVKDHLGRGGVAFHYRVEMATVQPSLDLTINEYARYVEHRLAVPQGGRCPILITATRREFGGPLEFLAEGLPPGVAIDAVTLNADQNVAQVQLVATAEAPLGGSLGQIMGRLNDPKEPNKQVFGRTRQDAVMVRGQNQNPFWTEALPSLAIAVTKAAPFSVQVVEPKVPLVQNGVMKLKVVATRAEGFTAPIKVEVLQTPPGVNGSREAVIPEGQTETMIDLNAAGNAQVASHPICVRADADIGGGRVMTASPFVTLRVAEPYVKLAFQQSAIEQGASSEMVVKVENKQAFEGAAQVSLLGLPNKVTATPLELTKDGTELVFELKAEADAPPGMNKSVFCQVIVMQDGEPITHSLGSGVLRVDQPLPKKPAAPAATAAAPATPAPAAPAAAPPKRLSRLEQLRLEQKQKLEAQAGAGDAKPADAKPSGGN